jgi:septum site-determining protein MinC
MSIEENNLPTRTKGNIGKELVDFKGTRNGLLIILDEDAKFDTIKASLRQKFEASRDFFTRSEVVVDTGGRKFSDEETLELAKIIRDECGLRCRRIGNKFIDDGDLEENLYRVERRFETILVKRTIRSGQRLYHDGNIVILGDVNPGAEIVATGDVVVMGTLRGVVHAGVDGKEDAVIIATSLMPTQIRIADFITRAPDDEDGTSRAVPEMARIRGGYVVIETYSSRSSFTG